ncbi:hypothetical protein [Microbacterium trichothecenolyticum]|uniref:Uncharacterized protein n=1 Tax=Microbacterium trichothecenolyticum TaxID=69370 RepID=A0A0M2HKZ0_MICTR|nr:hypothetical protein [Microbacterium trichothecenolyticum]KJL45565.1 hypothetical protein RS82_00117 [Microbacterium trichothecenolyticum]
MGGYQTAQPDEIAGILARAQYKWESAGIACAVAFYGDSHETGVLLEGDQTLRFGLIPRPMYDGQQAGRIVDDGRVDGKRVRDSLAMDANLVPLATIWWIGGYAFEVDDEAAEIPETPEGYSSIDSDIDPDGIMLVHDACGEDADFCECGPDAYEYDPLRYANARARVLAWLKSHEGAFEPEDNDETIIWAGLDCYGSGSDMHERTDDQALAADYRYFAANYPAGDDVVEGQPAPAEVAGEVDWDAARKLVEAWDAAQSDLADATNDDGEVDYNSRAWESYEDKTSGLDAAFAEVVRAALRARGQ